MNFTSILHRVMKAFPSKVFIFENDKTVNYNEFWQQMERVNALYVEKGIKPGDRVAIALPNSIDLLLYHFGALKMGAVSIPIKYDNQFRELSKIFANCRPHLLVTCDSWREQHFSQLQSFGLSHLLITIDQFPLQLIQPIRGIYPARNDDVASINYSYSGDGYPKGAVLTHGNHIYAAAGYVRHMGFVPEDVFLITLPMQHVFALSGCVNSAILKGASLVIVGSFTPKAILGAVDQFKITVLSAVPPLYELLANFKRKDNYSLSTLRLCVTGGDFMPADLQEK